MTSLRIERRLTAALTARQLTAMWGEANACSERPERTEAIQSNCRSDLGYWPVSTSAAMQRYFPSWEKPTLCGQGRSVEIDPIQKWNLHQQSRMTALPVNGLTAPLFVSGARPTIEFVGKAGAEIADRRSGATISNICRDVHEARSLKIGISVPS